MLNPARKGHLRLVSSAEADKDDFINSSSRSFCGPAESVPVWMISENTILRNERFLSFLEESRTQSLLDVRIAPRMDFIASNRVRAFKLLSDLGIDYVDVSGVLSSAGDFGFGLMPENWIGLLSEKISSLSSTLNAVTIIFDNDDIMRRSQFVLRAALTASEGERRARIEILSELPSELIAL
jgi:hypothetical protein